MFNPWKKSNLPSLNDEMQGIIYKLQAFTEESQIKFVGGGTKN